MCFGHEGSVRKRWPCVFLGQKNEVMPASATDYQSSTDMDDGGSKECSTGETSSNGQPRVGKQGTTPPLTDGEAGKAAQSRPAAVMAVQR